MTNTLASRWRVLAELVPKLVACLLILVIGYIVMQVTDLNPFTLNGVRPCEGRSGSTSRARSSSREAVSRS